MRITHVINSLSTAGAERLVVNLCLEMRKKGHAVRIVTLSDTPGIPLLLAQSSGIDVISLGHAPRNPASILRLSKATRSSDIVHAHLFPTLYFASLAGITSPMVFTEHSTHNRRTGISALAPFERMAYRRFDKIIAISSGVRSSLQSHFLEIGLNKEIETIQNGIGAEFFHSRHGVTPRGAGPLRLIAIGTLKSSKNLQDSIAAVARVPATTLTIVGNGPQQAELMALVERLHLSDRVSFLGQRSDISDLLDEHHVLLSTSLFEGFGLGAAEAMARGCPVIGPDISGLNEVVDNGRSGLLFKAGTNSIDELVEHILTLRDDSVTYERLARQAYSGSSRFNIEVAAEAYLQTYASTARG